MAAPWVTSCGHPRSFLASTPAFFKLRLTILGPFSKCTKHAAKLPQGSRAAIESDVKRLPSGSVRPEALRLMEQACLPVKGLRSKSRDEFARPEAPKPDFIFTLCDKAAKEVRPIWPGQPMTARGV